MKKRILLIFLAMVLVVSLAAFGACVKEEPVEFSLKITAVGEGTTSPTPGTSTITEGESVTVTAIPNSGYEFDSWEGDVFGTTNPITFKMKSDMSVVAVFVEEEVPPVEEVWQWPDKLVIASVGTESPSYGCAIAWTTPFAEETGMKVRVVCEGNVSLRHIWLRDGLFFCSCEAKSGKYILEAEEAYATRNGGPWQVRSLYSSAKVDMGFAVPADSAIKTPYDIKPGTRIIYMTFIGPAGREVMEALLAWGQVDPEDVVWVPAGSMAANVRLLMDGKGDVTFGWNTASPALYEAEAAPHGLSWIELNAAADPEAAKRYVAVSPESSFGVITTGVPSALGVYSLSSIAPYTISAEIDPELVYQVVKWLAENHDKYKDAHPWCQEMTIDNLVHLAETDFVPLHEGTVRYLEEIGRWTPAHEARNQHNIDLVTRYVEAYQEAIDMADEQGIKVDPANEEWLELWYSYKEKLPPFKLFIGLD